MTTGNDDETVPKPVPRTRTVHWLANLSLLAIAIVLVVVPFEYLFRYRYVHLLYTPRPEVSAVQQYLTLDPDVGFTWQPNVSPERNVHFTINDVNPTPLSTDAFGIMNLPEAIAGHAANGSVDVIGLGDSFMEIAHRGFYNRLRDIGLSYYSLAIHRQCPSQYNVLFERHGVAMHPKWIIYGLFENDFSETTDFQGWKTSGIDWFTYHSGTWCGPAIGENPLQRLIRTRARGWYAFTRVLNAHLRGERVTLTGPSREEIDRVASEILAAKQRSQDLNARFVLLLIPGKQTSTVAETLEAKAYDSVLQRLPMFSESEVLDLRSVFNNHLDPGSLYYQIDGHWNERGVALAADQLVRLLELHTP